MPIRLRKYIGRVVIEGLAQDFDFDGNPIGPPYPWPRRKDRPMKSYTQFALKSGEFFLLRYPSLHGVVEPIAAAMYAGFLPASDDLTEMKAEAVRGDKPTETLILQAARVVRLTIVETDASVVPAIPGLPS